MGNPKRGHFSRSRSLEDFERKFKPGVLVKAIRKAGKNARVLEVGCGEGRILMELRKIFPNIELHGINKKPWPAMAGTESLKKTALYYNIFTQKELKHVKLPKIHFFDAKKMKFKSNCFDAIYSQVSIPYIDRKDLFIEEVWRTLKKRGVAFLHIDSWDEKYPDFMQHKTPRFIIYKHEKEYLLKNLVSSLRKKGYDIRYIKTGSKVKLVIKKNTSKKLNLNLKFDELSSFNLNLLNEENKNWDVYWGYRSVFRI